MGYNINNQTKIHYKKHSQHGKHYSKTIVTLLLNVTILLDTEF